MSFDLEIYFNRIPDNFSDQMSEEVNTLWRSTPLRQKFEFLETEIEIPSDWQQSLTWDFDDSKIPITTDTAALAGQWSLPDHVKARLAKQKYACHVSSMFTTGPILLAFAAVFAKHCDALVADFQSVPTLMNFLEHLPKPKSESCWPELGIYDADMTLRIFEIVTQSVDD
jgi:hypothetical protein